MHWNVGEVRVTRVVEREVEFPASGLLPELTSEIIDGLGEWASPYFTADHKIRLSIHSFIVQSPDTTMVVDTCVGAHTERMIPGDAEFGDRLVNALPGGLASVDVVVCTHLHFDHVGWNTIEVDGAMVPMFPNARYLVSDAELTGTFEDDHMEVIEPSIRPLLDAGVLDAVASGHRIDNSLRLVPSAGHSPGHVCVGIDSNGSSGLITGDSFHSAAQVAHPEIASSADYDSRASTATRNALLADLVDGPTVMFGSHFSVPTAGRVRSGRDTNWLDPIDPD